MPTPSLGLSAWRWNNNLKSTLLLLAFPALLLALLGAVFYGVGLVQASPNGRIAPSLFRELGLDPTLASSTPWGLAEAALFAWWPIVLGIAAIWVLIGYIFNSAMIRAATSAVPVERRDAAQLYNMLENLCIARGLRVPKLYIIDDSAMNAFASGLDANSYSITVTRGLLERLNPAEVEAVLAHELTHILNRDVRLLVVTIVFVGMISFLAQMLWRSLQFASYSRRNRETGKGGAVLVMVGAVVMAIGYVLALLLRFAISRKREYLADAGSVELTKNPEAMITALEKIAAHPHLPNVPPEVRQMFIENPPSAFGLFDTHPPIQDRIRVLREIGGLTSLRGESIIPPAG